MIPSDLNPFQYCSNLRGTTKFHVPVNQEASSSRYINPYSLNKVSTSSTILSNSKVQFHYMGCGKYHMGKLQINDNANAATKVSTSNNDVKTVSEDTQIDDRVWIGISWDPNDISTFSISTSTQNFHVHENPMFDHDIYDNALFDLEPVEDIHTSSFHTAYPGLGYVHPTASYTNPSFQVIKDMEASFDVNGMKKG